MSFQNLGTSLHDIICSKFPLTTLVFATVKPAKAVIIHDHMDVAMNPEGIQRIKENPTF